MSAIREQRLELGGFGTRALEVRAGSAAASAPPLLLIHGYSDSADTWRPLLGRLAKRGWTAIAVDLPGFGGADRLDRERPVLEQLDRFVAAAIRDTSERTGGGPVLVAGNSLGGCAALRAAERPELPLAGIVPIAPAGLDMAGWIALVESAPLIRLILRAPVPLPELFVREAVGRAYRTLAFARPSAVDPAVVNSFTRHLRTRRDVIRVSATGRRLRPEIGDPFRLERVAFPVLVVWGDSDRLVFASGAERILRAIPGARLEVFERCGHCPQIECPDRLADVLSRFAARTPERIRA